LKAVHEAAELLYGEDFQHEVEDGEPDEGVGPGLEEPAGEEYLEGGLSAWFEEMGWELGKKYLADEYLLRESYSRHGVAESSTIGRWGRRLVSGEQKSNSCISNESHLSSI
jgi:hypothetical protein